MVVTKRAKEVSKKNKRKLTRSDLINLTKKFQFHYFY